MYLTEEYRELFQDIQEAVKQSASRLKGKDFNIEVIVHYLVIESEQKSTFKEHRCIVVDDNQERKFSIKTFEHFGDEPILKIQHLEFKKVTLDDFLTAEEIEEVNDLGAEK